MKTLSVIVPCFNAEPWIEEALNSIFSQGLSDLEVIVVDDGSTDRSAQVVKQKFPSVHLIQTANQGPSHARNTGTQASDGRFIQYLDADDVLAEGKLRTQLEMLEKTGADVAYGDWQELEKTPTGSYAKKRLVSRQIPKEAEVALFTDFWCPPAAYLFRCSIVSAVGEWKKNLPIIQDARFVLDCALKGARFAYCPGVMAYYRKSSQESVSKKDPKAFLRDCFVNAQEVQTWWESHGGLNKERREALLKVYLQVTRGSFKKDPEIFEKAEMILKKLDSNYLSQGPKRLAVASKIFGYRGAEWMAWHYRAFKHFLSRKSS